MELVWIDDFLALESTRNFTRAADMRATTQSAYSRRIQRLEDWLGVPLFERTQRPVALTPAGHDFSQRARRLRDDIMDLRRNALASASSLVQSTRIYTTNTLAAGFFAGWAVEHKLGNYALVVAAMTSCIEAVRAGRAQMAIVPGLDDIDLRGPWKSQVIGHDRLVLAATPKVAKHIALRGRKLTGPLMMYAPGSTYSAQIRKLLAQHKVTIDGAPICESASAEALAAQALAGVGAAWIPHTLMGKGLVRCSLPAGYDCEYDILLLDRTAVSAVDITDAA